MPCIMIPDERTSKRQYWEKLEQLIPESKRNSLRAEFTQRLLEILTLRLLQMNSRS